MLVLAVSDPLAALSGKKWPLGKYKILNETKTLAGSSAFFVSAVIILFILMLAFESPAKTSAVFAYSFCTAAAATISEAVSTKGFDNLFIPVTVLIVILTI